MGRRREFTIGEATLEDCVELAPLLRPADALEARRALGGDPLTGLTASLANSSRAWTVRDDLGRILLISGYFSPDGRLAMPWSLTSTAVEERRGAFLLACREILNRLAGFEVLGNFVDADNQTSLRFLRRLGFSIGAEPVALGPQGHPFLPFFKEA